MTINNNGLISHDDILMPDVVVGEDLRGVSTITFYKGFTMTIMPIHNYITFNANASFEYLHPTWTRVTLINNVAAYVSDYTQVKNSQSAHVIETNLIKTPHQHQYILEADFHA